LPFSHAGFPEPGRREAASVTAAGKRPLTLQYKPQGNHRVVGAPPRAPWKRKTVQPTETFFWKKIFQQSGIHICAY